MNSNSETSQEPSVADLASDALDMYKSALGQRLGFLIQPPSLEHISECSTLRRQVSAYKLLTESLEKQLSHHSAKADEYRAAIATLESERQSNAVLTAECEKLKDDVAELEGGRELNRYAIKNLKAARDVWKATAEQHKDNYDRINGSLRIELASTKAERDELADKLTSQQENIDNKQLQVEELAAQVEKMRKALSTCQTWKEIKEFGPSIWRRNYDEKLVKEALALPDLSAKKHEDGA